MRVFVTGATGYLGSAVVQDLLRAGHQVLGLVRSVDGAGKLPPGVEAHVGTLDDPDGLARGAAAADGVIHTAFNHDFSQYAAAGETDRRAVEAMAAALAGSGRPLVVTSVTTLLPTGRLVTEDDRPDPQSASATRLPSEQAVAAAATRGVRASAVRLPPTVHSDQDRAFVPMLIAHARTAGASAYVGDGANRWPAVHRLDAARLFRLALERGEANGRYHAVADEGVPFRDIAGVIGHRLGVPVVRRTPDEAGAHFGWLTTFATLDNPTSSARTRERLAWTPERPHLLADLDQPHYFAAAPEMAAA